MDSKDKTVRQWDIVASRCLHTLQGHIDTVRCVQFDQDKIISGSDDSTCKIYDLEEGELTINAHPDHKVTCLQFDSNKLITGSSDSTMKLWSVETCEHLYTLEAKGSAWVRCLQYAQELLVSGHGDNNIR